MMREMSSESTLFVAVEKKLMGLVIGSKGKKIKKVEESTQTRITSRNGRQTGFEVTGPPCNCEKAELAIRHSIDNSNASIEIRVPQEFVRLLIARHSNENFRQIENEHGVKISWTKFTGEESHVTFTVKGVRVNCVRARNKMRANIEEWGENSVCEEPALSAACKGFGTHSAVKNEPRIFKAPSEYIGLVVGKGHWTIEHIETKSETKIIVPSRQRTKDGGDKIALKILGSPENCNRAVSLIQQCILDCKEKMKRQEYGGDVKFVCVDFRDKCGEFQLKEETNPPKMDGFMIGPRYRVEAVIESKNDFKCDYESENDIYQKVSEYLLGSLQELKKKMDKKELLVDLWCHFGKVLVSKVDEEESMNVIKLDDVKQRLKQKNRTTLNDKNAYWHVSFEEGVKPSDINEDALLQTADESDTDENFGEFKLKLVHTQWRYDFGFITPSVRSVRFKAWEGLPFDKADRPPVEVKNILRQVVLQKDERIKAWLCYPSTTVLRGQVMIPQSLYDYRMKLRVGPRCAIEEKSVFVEEDEILSNYLSHCKIDTVNHRMEQPDEKDHEMPEDFTCTFYRRAEESMFRACVEDESFLVIVLKETGWDSDNSEKRYHNQFGIRIVMDAWSEALLSPKRNWEPEEILDKLKIYLEFLSLLQNHLF